MDAHRRAGFLPLVLAALLAHAGAASGASVLLRWTAPGDDGMNGRATQYDLRYSTTTINATSFPAALQATTEPAPSLAGRADSCRIDGLQQNVVYYLALRTRDEANNWSGLSNVVVVINGSTADVPGEGAGVAFGRPRPNPARTTVRFGLALPSAGEVRVQVHDAAGRRVRTLAEGHRPAGAGEVTWDLRDESGAPVAAGWYVALARLPGRTSSQRILVVR